MKEGLAKKKISACGYNGTSFVSIIDHVTNKNAVFLTDFSGHTDRQLNYSGNLCSVSCNVKITFTQLKTSQSLCKCGCYSNLTNSLFVQIVKF